MISFTRLNTYKRRFVCFRVTLFPPFGLALAFGVAPLGLALAFGVAPLGLALAREAPTRRNKQSREMDDTVMCDGSTYLIFWVRLKMVLTRLGRFLAQSTATKLVSGL